MTWSIEKAVLRAGDSFWSAVDVVGTVVYDACTLLGALTMPRDDGAEQLAQAEEEQEVWEPADHPYKQPVSPAASAGGPSEVDSGNPPATNPSEGHSPIAFVDWASPAIHTVLDNHIYAPANHSSIGSFAHCSCGFRPDGVWEWQEHVSVKVADHLEMALDRTNVFELNRVNSTPVK